MKTHENTVRELSVNELDLIGGGAGGGGTVSGSSYKVTTSPEKSTITQSQVSGPSGSGGSGGGALTSLMGALI